MPESVAMSVSERIQKHGMENTFLKACTLQSDRLGERNNSTLFDKIHVLFVYLHLNKLVFSETVLQALYLLNVVPLSASSGWKL